MDFIIAWNLSIKVFNIRKKNLASLSLKKF